MTGQNDCIVIHPQDDVTKAAIHGCWVSTWQVSATDGALKKHISTEDDGWLLLLPRNFEHHTPLGVPRGMGYTQSEASNIEHFSIIEGADVLRVGEFKFTRCHGQELIARHRESAADGIREAIAIFRMDVGGDSMIFREGTN